MDKPISERFSLDLDANGYVTGVSLRNDGPSGSQLRTQADTIRIALPGKQVSLTPFDAAKHLTDPSDVAEILTAALESGNPNTIAAACAVVARTTPTEGNDHA